MRIKVNWFVRFVAKVARVDLDSYACEDKKDKKRGSVDFSKVMAQPLLPPRLQSDLKRIIEEQAELAEKITGVNQPHTGRSLTQAGQWNETTFTVGTAEDPQELLENIYWPVTKGNGPGEVTVDPLSQAREDALEEINRQYAIPKELWDKFRTEEQMGKYYREQLEEYILANAQSDAPPRTTAKEYAEVVYRALQRMSGVETPPRLQFSPTQDKLIISPPPPDLEDDLGVDGCEIPEEMFD
jgi:hypothetical protein